MLAINNIKQCSTCKLPQPLTSFPKDRKRPDGRHPRCSACRKTYYLKNRDREVAKQREYNKNNREKVLQSHKDYAYKRFFYIKANNLKLRGGTASVVELARLWRKQRGLCVITGIRLTRNNSQLDHVIPIVQGGAGIIENLRWVHRDVNYAKRDLSDQDFFQLCAEVSARNPLKRG